MVEMDFNADIQDNKMCLEQDMKAKVEVAVMILLFSA